MRDNKRLDALVRRWRDLAEFADPRDREARSGWAAHLARVASQDASLQQEAEKPEADGKT
jgi:hypothetical protein